MKSNSKSESTIESTKVSDRNILNRELQDDEIQQGFDYWRGRFFSPRLTEEVVTKKGWIFAARQAQFLTTMTLASKMNISKQAFSGIEKREQTKNLKIKTLIKAAEALDCEMIYYFRLKNQKTFAQNIWDKIFPEISNHPRLNVCDQKRRGRALGALARDRMQTQRFRKSQNL